MHTILETITRHARAVTIAAALGATVFTGAPVLAQPVFDFEVQVAPDFDDEECLSVRRIVRLLRARGYRNISLRNDLGDELIFRARRGDRVYRLGVDACTGDILWRERIRRF